MLLNDAIINKKQIHNHKRKIPNGIREINTEKKQLNEKFNNENKLQRKVNLPLKRKDT
jgi:hypothetical protein